MKIEQLLVMSLNKLLLSQNQGLPYVKHIKITFQNRLIFVIEMSEILSAFQEKNYEKINMFFTYFTYSGGIF